MTSAYLLQGDMLETLKQLPDNSVHAVVTDPPYHLTSIVKRFGKEGSAPAKFGTDGAFARASRGFMGKEWDGGDIAFRPETWYEVLRVLKPGGHLLAFGGSRTYHRIAVAIEDAGFEIRDTIMWLYGSGFPKSHDVSKGIDKHLGAQRDLAKPRSVIGHQRNIGNHRPWMDDPDHMTVSDVPASPEATQWAGWGSALKPAHEPIILARKPLEGTLAANTLKWGCGGINIDESRIGTEGGTRKADTKEASLTKTVTAFGNGLNGGVVVALDKVRFPANVLHDGSDEVLDAFAVYGERKSGASNGKRNPDQDRKVLSKFSGTEAGCYLREASTGTAARFFYSAKASAKDRDGSKHPTVKPQALMRYLVKLVTPPNGTVLDCFAGSGSTGVAALAEGFNTVLCEREAEYCQDIQRRIPGIKVFAKKAVA